MNKVHYKIHSLNNSIPKIQLELLSLEAHSNYSRAKRLFDEHENNLLMHTILHANIGLCKKREFVQFYEVEHLLITLLTTNVH